MLKLLPEKVVMCDVKVLLREVKSLVTEMTGQDGPMSRAGRNLGSKERSASLDEPDQMWCSPWDVHGGPLGAELKLALGGRRNCQHHRRTSPDVVDAAMMLAKMERWMS